MIFSMNILFSLFVHAGPMDRLEECANRFSSQPTKANLCMNKILLRQIRRSRGGGNQNTDLGEIRFYHDDGQCSSRVIGAMQVSSDGMTNRRRCGLINFSNSIWGAGYDLDGVSGCKNLSDQSGNATGCIAALRQLDIAVD